MNETVELKELDIYKSTLETVDFALYEWVNEKINPHANTAEGYKKVPVIWTSSERTHQIKNNKDIRDSSGMLLFPIISIDRTGFKKDANKRGALPAYLIPQNDEKGGTITVSRVIQQEKTSNYNNADRTRLIGGNNNVSRLSIKDPRAIKKVVYETTTIPMPIPIVVNYSIFIKADYVQQINEIISPFLTTVYNNRYFVINKDGHKFEAFLSNDFTQENNYASLNEERKIYGTKIDVEVEARIIDEQNKPNIVVRENAVKVLIPSEHTIVGDYEQFLIAIKNKTSYRQ
jgi:hypothetical protein